ncbi:hypothetical protein N2152v2_006537 [Parachlorella kessleri]
MASKDNRTLPSKEATLFRQLVKHYEGKTYKKGLKAADSILKKFPEHGETLAMKGLLLNCMEKKEEAYELVKRGVKNDIKSHVCWHVYGLLYRSDREYDEAIKCYKNALRMDKDNQQVLRDLALLQIQMRDLPGFLESRQQLLDLKPANKQNWVALALAHHLAGHHEVAARVLDAYIGTMDEDVPASEAYEHSELLLYKARILEEAPNGLFAESLAILDAAEGKRQIKDPLGLLEARGRLLLAQRQFDRAEQIYRRLIAVTPDNHRYHFGLLAALQLTLKPPAAAAGTAQQAPAPLSATAALAPDLSGLSEAQRAALGEVYAELQAQHPHSAACKRLPLDFLEGEAFLAAAEPYVQRYLHKGIPSLFRDLRPLYDNSAKKQQLGQLFVRLEQAAAAEAASTSSDAANGATAAVPVEQQQAERGAEQAQQHEQQQQHNPHHKENVLLWVRLYLAQHHDLLGDTGEALRLVDQCIEMNPDLIEAHSLRARVLRHAGDLEGAAHAADTARSMDLSDRYLNCLAVKALFRAGNIEEAERLAALFTRDGEQANNLFDMQAMWYEIHSGRAFLARKDYGRALKRFLKVDSHFADFVEDQFDFHGYCLRKQTMRAYVDMLRMEDKLYAHPTYSKAMAGAVQAYLDLYDHPPKSAEQQEEELLAGMSAEEQKRYRQRKRKEEQRRQKEEAEAAARAAAAEAAAAAKKGHDKGEPKKKDTDPDGVQLAATPDPLGEASKLVRRLVEHAGDSLNTHLLAFEVYLRKGKLLLALRAAQQAQRLAGPAHPRTHLALLRLALRAEQLPQQQPVAAANPLVTDLVQQGVKEALGGLSPGEYHAQWAQQQCGDGSGGGSLLQRAAAAEGAAALGGPEKAQAAVQQLLQAGPGGAAHKDAQAVHQLLKAGLRDEAGAEQWRQQCAAVFRWSRYFGGADCVALAAEAATDSGTANGVAEKVAALAV